MRTDRRNLFFAPQSPVQCAYTVFFRTRMFRATDRPRT